MFNDTPFNPLLFVCLFVWLLQPAFTLTTKVTFDARAQAMNLIKTLPLDYLMCRIYPRLYALHLLTEKVWNISEVYSSRIWLWALALLLAIIVYAHTFTWGDSFSGWEVLVFEILSVWQQMGRSRVILENKVLIFVRPSKLLLCSQLLLSKIACFVGFCQMSCIYFVLQRYSFVT